jgi:hypothetical protein
MNTLLFIPHHHTLQYGGKWSYSYSCSDQDGMFCLEYVGGGSAVWTINIHLQMCILLR